MFKCGITGKLSRLGEKPVKLVTEQRSKEYFVPGPKPELPPVLVGRGWEIVKEINVTLEGLTRWVTQHPEDAIAAETLGRLVKAREVEQRRRNEPIKLEEQDAR